MKPRGKLAKSLQEHGHLGHAYHDFLQSQQPIARWEDVGLLAEPIPIDTAYPIDWKLANRWAAACPALGRVLGEAELFDSLSVLLGWQYAWTRFQQHLFLLDVIEDLFAEQPPNLILEPGCFTGGLLHFLAASLPDVPCVGFDISPVSLDVCAHYSDRLGRDNRPLWIEANFCQIEPAHLPESMQPRVAGGLVILSNAIEALGKAFQCFPYANTWSLRSQLVSYWVNQGATVLLCERHPDLDDLLNTIVYQGRWEKEGCTGAVLKRFKAATTVEMTETNPLGDWVNADCGVLCFSPSGNGA